MDRQSLPDDQLAPEWVAVVIPAYNAEATIDETLHSVRAQTHRALEIIVVDDGSRDNTRSIVEQHAAADARVRLLHQANGGVAAARNLGIAQTKAALIAFVDADDLWAPDKIEKQLGALQQGGPRVGLVYCWSALIDEGSTVIDLDHRPLHGGDVLDRMCELNLVANGSSPLIPRAVLDDVGGFDASLRARRAQGCEDLDLYLRIAERYDYAVVGEHLTGYRQLSGAMSSDLMQMLRSWKLVSASAAQRRPECRQALERGVTNCIAWLLVRAIQYRRPRDAGRLAGELVLRDPLQLGSIGWRAANVAARRLFGRSSPRVRRLGNRAGRPFIPS